MEVKARKSRDNERKREKKEKRREKTSKKKKKSFIYVRRVISSGTNSQ